MPRLTKFIYLLCGFTSTDYIQDCEVCCSQVSASKATKTPQELATESAESLHESSQWSRYTINTLRTTTTTKNNNRHPLCLQFYEHSGSHSSDDYRFQLGLFCLKHVEWSWGFFRKDFVHLSLLWRLKNCDLKKTLETLNDKCAERYLQTIGAHTCTSGCDIASGMLFIDSP